MRAAWVTLLALAWPAPAPAAAPLALPCVADTSICLHEAEVDLNQGGKRHLRLKGIQHLLLLDFDWAPLARRRVRSARLVLTPAGPTKLKTLGISTVATAWGEGTGVDRPAGDGECSSRKPGPAGQTWAGPGTTILDATFTAGGTLVDYADVEALPDGRLAVAVAPRLVHACVRGEGHGLAVCDEKGQTMANHDFRSREDRAGAILEVEPDDAPAPPSGAGRVAIPTAPPVRPPQAAPVPAMRDIRNYVAGDDRVHVELMPDLDRTAEPRPATTGGGAPPQPLEIVAPRGGTLAVLCEVRTPDARAVAVQVQGLPAPRVWRVLNLAGPSTWDACVPVDQAAPATSSLYLVESSVPKDAPIARSSVSLSFEGVVVGFVLKVAAPVLPPSPTFQVSLNTYGSPGGALGDTEGWPEFVALERDAYRLAHAHRCTLTPLPYSQSGKVVYAMAPDRADDGTWAFRDYDARVGPLLDGSAFADLPRGAVPLDHFYLPLHENWPLPIAAHYAYRGTLDDHWKDAPPIEAAFPAAYAAGFRDATTAFVRHAGARGWTQTRFLCYLNNTLDFRRTGRGTSWWRLDEPAYRDDFRAIAWFGRLFRAGVEVAGPDSGRFLFRVDLSRPEWRRDHLDGLLGLVVTNRWDDRAAMILAKARAHGEEVWAYGEAPSPRRPPVETWAWVMRACLAGAYGMVPWQSVGTPGAWLSPDATALILPARPGLPRGFYPTLRLKMLRAACEAAELVQQVEKRRGFTRAEIAAAFAKAGILPTEGSPPPDAPDRAVAVLCGWLDG